MRSVVTFGVIEFSFGVSGISFGVLIFHHYLEPIWELARAMKTPPLGKFATRPSNTFSKAMEKVLEGLLKKGVNALFEAANKIFPYRLAVRDIFCTFAR